MKTPSLPAFTVLLVLVLPLSAAIAQTQNMTSWQVTRHTDTTFTQAHLDNRLLVANNAIRLDDEHCSDHPCQLNIVQSGEIGVYGSPGDGGAFIGFESRLQAAYDAPGRVAVVTSIAYCGGEVNESFIGCGQCSGNNFVVENWAPGQTWVHEFGHNQQDLLDCGHRNSCEHNLMHETLSGADSLTTSECTMLTGINAHQWCGEMIMLSEPEWFNWVACPSWVPTGGPWNGLFVTKPFDEWQFRVGTTLTSYGEFSTPGGIVHMYSNSAENDLPGLKLTEYGRLKIINGGQIKFHEPSTSN